MKVFSRPPRLAQKILEYLAGSAASVEDLIGDLDEGFYRNLQRKSYFKAALLYWAQTLSLCFSYAIKKRKRDSSYSAYATSTASFAMLRNYIKVAVRNIYQYRYFSILNAFGLAIGMSVSLLLLAVVSYVRTYDDFHVNAKDIYTVVSHRHTGAEENNYATAPAILADKLTSEFTGAKAVVRIALDNSLEVKNTRENIPVRSYFVEPEFLSAFSFHLLEGNAASLNSPDKIILTEAASVRLFGDEKRVVGKTLEMTTGKTFEVAGVMRDIPRNSHMTFEMLVSYSSIPTDQRTATEQWTNYRNHYIYVWLDESTQPERLQDYLNTTAAKTFAQLPVKVTYSTEALLDIAMGPDRQQAIGPKWEMSGFLFFGVFAALILLPACFNYINMSIARTMQRSKEIGLRKTMGGTWREVVLQFITETVVITLLSSAGSLLIFLLIRGEFQPMLVAGSSSLDFSLTWQMLTMFVLFAIATGVLTGLFPALHFARLNPIQALKNKINTRGGSSLRLRTVLTVFQFALSFGFILFLTMFARQYRYSMNFDFGFEKKNIIDVPLQDVGQNQFTATFATLGAIQSISMSSGLLGVSESHTWINAANDSTEIAQLFIDHQYLDNLGLKLVAGSNFTQSPGQEERAMIINETFLKTHGIKTPHDALGRVYAVEGRDLEVIGVVKDFHYAPLTEPIRQFMFRQNPARYTYANLRVSTHDAYALFTQLEDAWKRLPTQKKFEGRYLNDEVQEAYQTYKVLIKIIGFLGILAITISLLGMLGMVVYTTETKTKEMSIRKVMGAQVASIMMLLSKDYLKMMACAIFIAIPITTIMLNKLLPAVQYYSIDLSWWDVAGSALVLIALGLLTIASQIYKVATANPATILRSE
jgi:putative ABC transport system permease protein